LDTFVGQADNAMGMNILIIEDDKLTLNAVQHSIEKLGHTATIAKSGEDAIEQIQKSTFDLIICDIMMPGISGLSFVSVLRSVHLCFTPIIMMSTLNHGPLLDAAFSAGANDFINKPFTQEELAEKLKKFEARREPGKK
jgi:CheY-like chemotaxis protein